MLPVTLTKLSYAAYAFGFLGAAAGWSMFLARWLIQSKGIQSGTGELWHEVGQIVSRWSSSVLILSAVAVLLGFVLAIPSSTETTPTVQSHRAFLLRLAPIGALCLILVGLADGRMGSLDADWTSFVVLLWCGWLLASGWGALSRQAEVTGPFGWQLALVVDVIAIGLIAVILCCFRMTRLF